MTSSICPVCAGPTFEIRAKLVCRQCGTILETCCEGGPMAGGCPVESPNGLEPTDQPARSESSDNSRPG